jgi:hypothetical protein
MIILYGSHSHPLVPLTGFGMTAGASALAGYPFLAIGFALVATSLAGLILVQIRIAKKKQS